LGGQGRVAGIAAAARSLVLAAAEAVVGAAGRQDGVAGAERLWPDRSMSAAGGQADELELFPQRTYSADVRAVRALPGPVGAASPHDGAQPGRETHAVGHTHV